MGMITFPPYPIPVETAHGEGYILYIEPSGMLENDIFTVCLCETGKIKHYNSQQVTVSKNFTFNIKTDLK